MIFTLMMDPYNQAHISLSPLPQLLLWIASSPWPPTMWIVSDTFSQMVCIELLATPLVLVWHLKCALSCRPRTDLWSTCFCLMDHTPMWQHIHRLEKRANTLIHAHYS